MMHRCHAALIGIVGVCTFALGLTVANAPAQAPGYDNLPGTIAPVSELPPATVAEHVVGGDVNSDEPLDDLSVKERCTRSRRGRTCRTYENGDLTRTCTTSGAGRKLRRICRFYATIDGASEHVRTCTKRGRAQERCSSERLSAASLPGRKARIAGLRRGSGYTNPVIKPVVRFYYGNQGWCSGTLVRRGIVLTAAHCLFANRTDGKGQYGYYDVNQLLVVPANTPNPPSSDAAPYGVWRVAQTFVPEGWKQEDGGLDWGIAVLTDQNGAYPGDQTGTFSAQWSAFLAPGERLYRVGYPASGPFGTAQYYYGGGQYFCDMEWDQADGTWVAGYIGSSYMLTTRPCEMNGGCSGGPVFAYFSDDREWRIVAVNNRGRNRPDQFGNPNPNDFGDVGIAFYLDRRFGEFWTQVMAQL
jgi:hypothetical protein